MDDISAILYKYRNWNNIFHKKSLRKNEVFLASPSDFNDPFDCRITPNFIQRTPAELSDYVNNVIERNQNQIVSKYSDLEDVRKHFLKRVLKNEEFQLESDQEHFLKQDTKYGVFCLSETWKSILMWSHYADSHRGFCIGYDVDKLLKSNLFGKGGTVSYDNTDTVSVLVQYQNRH